MGTNKTLALLEYLLSYGVRSKDYLFRAKELIAEDRIESLFYAAFEIRCGIEARMNEYLEVQKHISAKKKRGWKISQLANNIEDAFRLGEKKAIIQIVDSKSNEPVLSAEYTPVRKNGRKIAEQLGNYLHQAKSFYPDDSDHWVHFKKLLNTGVEELEFSTSGSLLGPPIYNSKTNDGFMYLEESHQDKLKYLQSSPQIIFKVDYE